ncbi:hypothetical protein JAAARDRAFT_522881 [Jaapia argillacea MUCL 33604]|uniref:Uncharacterized protein n=1 Tax=Jaapia argillacea MUCL 33604 TaxID=933084 RepID=A0A067Q416_9AGAM|nr:hypothetical protein JAAARDRAFT_522881 [Jaapia argillacea MUCL 33604]
MGHTSPEVLHPESPDRLKVTRRKFGFSPGQHQIRAQKLAPHASNTESGKLPPHPPPQPRFQSPHRRAQILLFESRSDPAEAPIKSLSLTPLSRSPSLPPSGRVPWSPSNAILGSDFLVYGAQIPATLEASLERADIETSKLPTAPLAAGPRVVGHLGGPSNLGLSKKLAYKLSRRPGVYGDDDDGDNEGDECDDDLVMFVGRLFCVIRICIWCHTKQLVAWTSETSNIRLEPPSATPNLRSCCSR